MCEKKVNDLKNQIEDYQSLEMNFQTDKIEIQKVLEVLKNKLRDAQMKVLNEQLKQDSDLQDKLKEKLDTVRKNNDQYLGRRMNEDNE